MKLKHITICSITFLAVLLICFTTSHINAAGPLPSDAEIRIDTIESAKFDFSAPNKDDQKLYLIQKAPLSTEIVSKNELDALNQELTGKSKPSLTPIAILHPETSELELLQYNSGPILINGSSSVILTLKLSGDNKIITHNFRDYNFGIKNTTPNGAVTIDNKDNSHPGKLYIGVWKDKNATNQTEVFGVDAPFVTLKENTVVEISLTNALNTDDSNSTGIKADTVTLSENANLKIISAVDSTDGNTLTTRAYGIHFDSRFQMDAGVTLDILLSRTAQDSIPFYSNQIRPFLLSHPEKTTLTWKNASGNQLEPSNVDIIISNELEKNEANENQDVTKKKVTFVPRKYAVMIKNGTIITTQGEVPSEKFAKDATVTIKAKDLASQLPFKTWESDVAVAFTSKTQKNTSFTMPNSDVAIIGQYNAFQTDPVFTENPAGTGTITLALNGTYANDSTAIEGYIVPYKGDLNDSDKRFPLTSLVSKNGNQTFTVTPQTLQSGRYEVYVKIDDIWHMSQTFMVNWQDYIAIEINLPSSIIYTKEIAPVITGLTQSPLEESKLSFAWYRDSLNTAPIATTRNYTPTAEDLGHHLILKVVHSEKQGFITEKSSVVEKKPNNTEPALTLDAYLVTANSIALKPEHSQYEIKDNTKNTAWGNEISSLSPSKTHQVAVRFKETDTHKASIAKIYLIRTKKGSAVAPLLPYAPSEEGKTEATKKPETPETAKPSASLFTDVAQDNWYSNAISFVYDRGLMKGVSETRFEPNAATTRGQLITILHRFAGSPKASTSKQFLDVMTKDYYQAAVTWAADNGIVSGYGDGTFGANDTITREQLAVLLYRFAGTKSADKKTTTNLSTFDDNTLISDYAKTAMTWAVENGLIQGTSKQMLSPKGIATRAEIATIFMRYHDQFAGEKK